MTTDSRRDPRVRVDSQDEAAYHEEFLKLTPDEVAAARVELYNPTERDIVKYWTIRPTRK